MLQIRSAHPAHATEVRLKNATERQGGTVLAITDMDPLLRGKGVSGGIHVMALTLCFNDLYATLFESDARFAALLPIRVAMWSGPEGVFLEAMSPRECCRMLRRPDLEPAAALLEERLRSVIEEAAKPPAPGAVAAKEEPHTATEDQMNVRGAVPQRIDCRGTKVEELGGVGKHDAQGG